MFASKTKKQEQKMKKEITCIKRPKKAPTNKLLKKK
jgi:hypothetical protein